jgi:hypothetical protein
VQPPSSHLALLASSTHWIDSTVVAVSPAKSKINCRFCGSNTVPPEIASDAGLEVDFSLALSQVS